MNARLCLMWIAAAACSPGPVGPGGSGGGSQPAIGCTSTSDGCLCATSMHNTTECSSFSVGSGTCCADDSWPSSGTCECQSAPAVACFINNDTLYCRCGPGVTRGSNDVPSTECDTGGTPNYHCCQ